MSLPAVSVPVAVLVLAWDETTPAVRALVEATEITDPALDSVVVLVPAGPATDELTPEEFLPLADSILPEELASLTAPADELPPAAPTPAAELPAASGEAAPASTPATPTPATLPAPPASAPEAALDQVTLGSEAVFSPIPAPPAIGLIGPDALTAAALNGPAVRILRLSEYSLVSLAEYTHQTLPALAWLSTAHIPATPYIGSLVTEEAPAGVQIRDSANAPVPGLIVTEKQLTMMESAVPPLPASPNYLPIELPTAPDAESDTTPAPAFEEPAPTASTSTTELGEEAADELTESFTADVTPVQAGWPEALASLQVPATWAKADEPAAAAKPAQAISTDFTEPAPVKADEALASPTQAALLPRASQFDAPNLNFQIIQYARFAVPLALAEPPFDVIYAPAWPTWLAAQELRQRTGLPLVLHIVALAAEEEHLDLAAGWPAEIQRQALHRADLILTETPALAYRLRRELDLPAHRVRPVPAADASAIAHALSTAQVHQVARPTAE